MQISQVQGPGRLGAYTLDTSQMPPGTVSLDGEDTDWRGDPVTLLRITEGIPIRIILAPATQP